MKINTLATALTSMLVAPLRAAPAPAPEHLEITLAVDSVAKSQSRFPDISLRFVGAEPSVFYALTEKIHWETFQISSYPQPYAISAFPLCQADFLL